MKTLQLQVTYSREGGTRDTDLDSQLARAIASVLHGMRFESLSQTVTVRGVSHIIEEADQ